MRWKGDKGKCWGVFRQIIFEMYGTDCYTCSRKDLMGVNLQCGHYLPVGLVGSNNKLSWDVNNCRPQCSRCNGVGQGEQAIFRANLVEELGEIEVRKLELRRFKIDPIKDWKGFYKQLEKTLSELK